MKFDELVEKLNLLEYHQKLLIKMLSETEQSFYKLVVEKSLKEKDVAALFSLCDKLSIDLKDQKAEGFVHFNPLFEKFETSLHPNLQAEEVIRSCLKQRLFMPLMEELSRCVSN